MEQSHLDHALSEDQSLIAGTVLDFASERVAPVHEALDHAGVHPEGLWGEIAELGLFGTFIPEDLGGADAGFLAHVVTVEILGAAGGLAGVLPVAQGIVIDALIGSKNEGAQAQHLEGLAMGEELGAPALQEDDPAVVLARAEGSGDSVTVSGEKTLVPFPGRASCYLVRARRDDEDFLVLVEADASGITHEGPEVALGLHGFETGTLRLSATPGTVLGGADLLDRVMTGARISVSALLAGIARGAVGHGTTYAAERIQFGVPLSKLTGIQERLASCDVRTEALRSLVHGAAALRDAKRPHAQAARRARQFAAENAVVVAHECLQVFGGYGFSREYPAERFYRDARFPGFGEHLHHDLVAASAAALE